jgi:hypothetical protein
MTAARSHSQPPRLATRFVALFASPEDGEAMLGDLAEEFPAIASEKGDARARRWYWRQCIRTAAHIVFGSMRARPWWTAGVVALSVVTVMVLQRAARSAGVALVTRYEVYQYVSPSVFWTSTLWLPWFVTGLCIALVYRKRPMVAAVVVVLSIAFILFVVDPIVLTFAKPGPSSPAYSIVDALRLLTTFGSLVVLGGLTGRTFVLPKHQRGPGARLV